MQIQHKFETILRNEPARWGLRGDRYLWRAIQSRLSEKTLPVSPSAFVQLIEDAYLAETHRRLFPGEFFLLKKFEHGGMSSGRIDPQFWCEKALPLLLGRYFRVMRQPQELVSKTSEKDLDRKLEQAFKTDPKFVDWFLRRTKFAGIPAIYEWSRSDHPWTTVAIAVESYPAGQASMVKREGETDIIVVLSVPGGKRVSLHIENKLAEGKFTALQPEMYPLRAEKWKRKAKYGNYDDWDTVLTAPKEFLRNNQSDAMKFGACVTHEDIAAHLPGFENDSA